ncbi:MAG: hypothetical protein KA792_04515 [Bacteroidales bacterium]|nr:hypothetical protein [Bacteroidales bacterium]
MINTGKHIIDEIDGVRCTIVESGISLESVNFLKELLEINKFEVKITKDKTTSSDSVQTFTIGVTDIVFNPTIAIYERSLFTKDGHRVTPAYWKQYTTVCDSRYWRKVER